MKGPITVLDLRDSPWVDGPGRTILETAQSLRQEGIKIIVGGFCDGDPADNVYLTEAKSRGLSTFPILERRAFDHKVFSQIVGAIDENDVDILHAHDFRSDLFGICCARWRHIPSVSTCHGWITNDRKGKLYKRFDLALLSKFDHIVTVSEALRSELVQRRIEGSKISVVSNALILDDYQPQATDRRYREELGIDDNVKLIVNIGRLSAEKGQSILLDAIAGVCAAGHGICLVFVGIGPEEEDLRERVRILGLDQEVRFAGFRSDMTRIYNSADLVVQSSLTEGMPNVVLESLLMKTPVVATKVGGTGEVVEHGRTGYLVAAGSAQELERGIVDFLDDEARHRQMAARGRVVIESSFAHDERVARMAKMYRVVSSERRTGC